MLTVDDPRVNFQRDYALPREDKLSEFCYRIWISQGVCK